uniref:Uncharacterized protein n=1 Tax=viral metagenome TaxID=1070528 RepID=A0A6H2A092_9ZZZZ
MDSTTIRISKETRERLSAIDKVPDRAIQQLLGQQNAVFTNVIEKVANKIVDEIEMRVRAIVREELERVKGG